MNREPTTLLIDADDTLWENNIYFENVATRFFTRLVAAGVDLARAEQALWETEQRNVKITGYGSSAFCRSLHETASALGVASLEPWIQEQEDWIFHHPIELMPGVADTLPRLAAGNRLILVTKGCEKEQHTKLERSGLAPYFPLIEVVFEKSVETYRTLAARHDLPLSSSYMIGNSPRSDINPARAAGLKTVFIPYHTTWQHEIEEIAPDGPETLMLDNFGDLERYFS